MTKRDPQPPASPPISWRCPGQGYTITERVCLARQAQGFGLCRRCPSRKRRQHR